MKLSPVPPLQRIEQIRGLVHEVIDDLVEAGLVVKLDVRMDDQAVHFILVISTPESVPAWKGEDDEAS